MSTALRPAALAVLVALLAGCASPPPAVQPIDLACRTELSSSHPATLGFWDALEANDVAARAGAIAALDAAHVEHPDEHELTLLLGLAQLWALADPLPGTTGAEMGALAGGVLSNLRAVRAGCPMDARVAAWLGPVLVRMGRLTGNAEFEAEGYAVLDEGVAADPQFVLFSLAMVLAEEPVDSPEFARAIDVLRDNIDVCGESGPDYACTNGPRAAHNVEGSAIFMGDIFARAGDVESARTMYEAALGTPGYASWPYQDVLADRLATLAERAALSQDADPTNDPLLVTSTPDSCAVCHAAR